jgi:hypothetical protein
MATLQQLSSTSTIVTIKNPHVLLYGCFTASTTFSPRPLSPDHYRVRSCRSYRSCRRGNAICGNGRPSRPVSRQVQQRGIRAVGTPTGPTCSEQQSRGSHCQQTGAHRLGRAVQPPRLSTSAAAATGGRLRFATITSSDSANQSFHTPKSESFRLTVSLNSWYSSPCRRP